VDLVNKYPREQLPASLIGYVHDRSGYDYLHHAEVGSSNAAFVGDEVTDRFCVLGTAEEHVGKLRELADAGVDQFNLYLMNGDEEAQLDLYGREVIPAFRPLPSHPSGADGTEVRLVSGLAVGDDGHASSEPRPNDARTTRPMWRLVWR
jgi:hypothetical protein